MFEALELGHKTSKKAFAEAEPELRTNLLEQQQRLREAGVQVVIVVAGVEGAGKGAVVNRLHKWMDSRHVETHAFWDEADVDRDRPPYWRFWHALPASGAIGIMFGSWYTRPMADRVFRSIDRAEFERQLRRIERFERLLVDDGQILIKFWFHLPKKEQRKRARAEAESGPGGSPYLQIFADNYERAIAAAADAVRRTDTVSAPWTLVEATDAEYRDLFVGRHLLSVFEGYNPVKRENPNTPPSPPPVSPDVSVLDRIDLSKSLSDEEYTESFDRYREELGRLAWRARADRRFTVAVFEGWDAAGKGGAIRRVTQAIDARLYKVISTGPPTDEERAHHYLWRFWRHIPRAGSMTIYDRSWYGRVLVERVEGLARPDEWRRAYTEINEFEEQLVEHGVILVKFWIHISKDEQLKRFEERGRVAWKRHKIGDADWRNREKWDDYAVAVDEMCSRTSTTHAPWTLVAGNDKKHARVEILRTFVERMRQGLDGK